MRGFGDYTEDLSASALKSRDGKDATDLIVTAIDARNHRAQPDGISGPLQAKPNGGQSLNYQNPIAIHAGNGADVSPSLTSEGADAGEDGNGRHAFALAYHENLSGNVAEANTARSLRAGASHSYQFAGGTMGVRRLTPTECEALQGFPRDWTLVDGTSDTARYRQLGNAVCVPVAEWIGRRIQEVDHAAPRRKE